MELLYEKERIQGLKIDTLMRDEVLEVAREEMCEQLVAWAKQVSYTWLSVSRTPRITIDRGEAAWLRFCHEATEEQVVQAYERVVYCQTHYPL